MAVRVNGDVVVNNSRELENIAGANGNYDSFHPNVRTLFSSPSVTTSMNNPFMSCTLTGNATFNITGAGTGKTSILILDRGSSGWTPSFSTVNWIEDSEPNWGTHRYWNVAFVCWSTSNVVAAASGF